MFSEKGIKARAARLWTGPSSRSLSALSPSSSFPATSISASRVLVPLLIAEAAAFALGAASGKIPLFLFTAIRALLTF